MLVDDEHLCKAVESWYWSKIMFCAVGGLLWEDVVKILNLFMNVQDSLFPLCVLWTEYSICEAISEQILSFD